MGNHISHKKFIFNEKIDREFLFSLYEDNYADIVEVFESCLGSFESETPVLRSAYDSGDLAALKKTVHKIKPVFGYAGLLRQEALAAEFESQIASAGEIVDIENEYHEFLDAIRESSKIIASDIQRLISFIS